MASQAKTWQTLFYFAALLPFPTLAPLELTVTKSHIVTVPDDPLEAQPAVQDIPGDASVFDETQWSDQRAQTLDDITDYSPRVIAQPRGVVAAIDSRAPGSQMPFKGRGLLVIQDGISLSMADGEFEFPVIDPRRIRYAEILPGANGSNRVRAARVRAAWAARSYAPGYAL